MKCEGLLLDLDHVREIYIHHLVGMGLVSRSWLRIPPRLSPRKLDELPIYVSMRTDTRFEVHFDPMDRQLMGWQELVAMWTDEALLTLESADSQASMARKLGVDRRVVAHYLKRRRVPLHLLYKLVGARPSWTYEGHGLVHALKEMKS